MAEFQILGKKPFAWFKRTVRSGGLGRAVGVAWFSLIDLWYDWRNGTDTVARLHPSQVETHSENKKRSSGYGATRALPFFGLLKQLNLPKDQTFVDLGSGKGRVMFLAAEWGFKRIVGIEFSTPLCDIARRNLEILRRGHRLPLETEIQIVESDVTLYEFGANDSILFLFDPFDSFILNRVLENLRASIRRHPRPVWLLYNTPAEHAAIMASGIFPSARRLVVRGTEYQVYSTVSGPG